MFNFGNKEFRNLQEQVLKNAQDIETLKGRENLQIVIVNELPEVGNPDYIYLVAKDDGESPDVYEEYIWLEDEERYELIGGVSIDLTNYVTTDTNQTISGAKTFTTDTNVGDNTQSESPKLGFISADATNQDNWYLFVNGNQQYFNICQLNGNNYVGIKFTRSSFLPTNTNYTSLGTESFRWKRIYVEATGIDFGNNATITKDSSNRLNFNFGGNTKVKVGANETYFAQHVEPDSNNTYDLGRNGVAWRDIYMTGSLKDGVNTVTVANISTKTTSTYASGTFDSNGESTIDISGGTPEGLFIFNCGNCQAMLHLTATMVQNAELTPIVVPCGFSENGNTQGYGTLRISKSGNTLTLFLGASALSHVDSGYAWTLVKTNLL